MGKREVKLCAGLLAVAVLAGIGGTQEVRAKAPNISASGHDIIVGKRMRLKVNQTGIKFKVSDPTIASVDNNGIVTGKKPGDVKVTARNRKKEKAVYDISVLAAEKKPNLPATFSEISIAASRMKEKKRGGYLYEAMIKNNSPVKIKKIVYVYQIRTAKYDKVKVKQTADEDVPPVSEDDETAVPDDELNVPDDETVVPDDGLAVPGDVPAVSDSAVEIVDTESPGGIASDVQMLKNHGLKRKKAYYRYVLDKSSIKSKKVKLTIKNLKAGKVSKPVKIEGDYSGKPGKMKLLRMELYAGNAAYIYKVSDRSYTLKWGKADKIAPTFQGVLENQSLCGDIPYLTVYSDWRENFNYTKFLSASDDRDKKVKIDTDTSEVNWDQSGRYKVSFVATDKGGNTARTWCWVDVVVPGAAEATADQILASIGANSGTHEEKARAIYQYIRNRMSYISHIEHPDYRTAALNGLRDCSGDCYTYYSISRLLLTRAGIPNLMVMRYPVVTTRHFWNLAYVNGGWYHFDTTPRSRGGTFCLLTDAQMHALYPGETFSFQEELYPARATKEIS